MRPSFDAMTACIFNDRRPSGKPNTSFRRSYTVHSPIAVRQSSRGMFATQTLHGQVQHAARETTDIVELRMFEVAPDELDWVQVGHRARQVLQSQPIPAWFRPGPRSQTPSRCRETCARRIHLLMAPCVTPSAVAMSCCFQPYCLRSLATGKDLRNAGPTMGPLP